MTHTIAPKAESFSAESLQELGYTSVRDLSERADLAPSTLAKFVRGQHRPTATLIAHLLAETKRPFSHWFVVVEVPEE